MLGIIRDGKIKRSNSQLLPPANGRIVDGKYVSDTDDYKPVVWLTSSITPARLGVYFPGRSCDLPEEDKRRIRIEIPSTIMLNIMPWTQFAKRNGVDPEWRDIITKGMNYASWYVTENEIPISAVARIIDLYDKKQIIWTNGD